MARSQKTISRRNQRSLGKIIADRFKGRSGVMLVGRPPDFSLRSEDWDGPLTADDICDLHLTGQACLGVYVVCDDDTCWFAAIDLDNKVERPDRTIRSKVTKVARCLAGGGVDFRVVYSQSGRGFHVLIFFSKAVPAWMARQFLKGVVKKVDVGDPEVFPKQDSVPAGKCGSAIRLPLFNKSQFIDPFNKWTELAPLASLRSVVSLSADDLRQAAARLGIELTAPPRPTSSRRKSTLTIANSRVPPSVKSLLADQFSLLARRWNGDVSGLKDSSQSGLIMSIACSLAGHGILTHDIEAAIRAWCAANNYAKGERRDWVELTVQRAEKFVAFRRQLPAGNHSAVNELAKSFSVPIARLVRKNSRRR